MGKHIITRTLTYATNKDGAMRLMLKNYDNLSKKVEVQAQVDIESGEVKFFLDKNDLKKLLGD